MEAEILGHEEEPNEEDSAKEFLLKTAARSLDSALKGLLLASCLRVEIFRLLILLFSLARDCPEEEVQQRQQEGLGQEEKEEQVQEEEGVQSSAWLHSGLVDPTSVSMLFKESLHDT